MPPGLEPPAVARNRKKSNCENTKKTASQYSSFDPIFFEMSLIVSFYKERYLIPWQCSAVFENKNRISYLDSVITSSCGEALSIFGVIQKFSST